MASGNHFSDKSIDDIKTTRLNFIQISISSFNICTTKASLVVISHWRRNIVISWAGRDGSFNKFRLVNDYRQIF